MREKPDTSSIPPAAQRIVFTLRTIGWISFGLQVVLGVVSAIILLVSVAFNTNTKTQGGTQGTGFGIFFAICGLVALGIGAFFAFRYTRISKQLLETGRPSKAETLQAIRLGLIVNLVGMLVTILGAQAVVGSVLTKSLSQQGAVLDPSRYVQPLDLFVVQGNVNTITAHFAGIVASLWLFNRVSK
ncbi:DUF3611 family protein [Allocoleopsis sp.]|uniref:DUF3611 family protein n=1 Tax=Allocoleopsis sp. TaxID=3088169 RepID=UPI002FD79DAB